jgi:hypothetical protein
MTCLAATLRAYTLCMAHSKTLVQWYSSHCTQWRNHCTQWHSSHTPWAPARVRSRRFVEQSSSPLYPAAQFTAVPSGTVHRCTQRHSSSLYSAAQFTAVLSGTVHHCTQRHKPLYSAAQTAVLSGTNRCTQRLRSVAERPKRGPDQSVGSADHAATCLNSYVKIGSPDLTSHQKSV